MYYRVINGHPWLLYKMMTDGCDVTWKRSQLATGISCVSCVGGEISARMLDIVALSDGKENLENYVAHLSKLWHDLDRIRRGVRLCSEP